MAKAIQRTRNSSLFKEVFGKLNIVVISSFPANINLDKIVAKINSLPEKEFIFNNIEEICIGKFDFLEKKEVYSSYQDGCVYLYNDIDTSFMSEEEIYRNILYAASFAIEEHHNDILYCDNSLEQEFRNKLEKLLLAVKEIYVDIPEKINLECPDNIQEFHSFLIEEIGPRYLKVLCTGIYVAPEACLSIDDYFANGIEEYFTGNKMYLQNVSPVLYSKIEGILSSFEEEI